MIFMGSYTGDRDGSSTDETTDEQPEEQPEDQPGLDDFNEPRDDTSDGDDGSGAPVTTVPGGGGSGADPTVPEVEEPPEDEPDEPEEPESDDGEVPEEPEPEVEEPDDVDESEQEEEHESEDEDEDDEEDKTVTVTVTVDPLSAMSWDIQPVLKKIQAFYGDQVEVEFQLAPVRTFDDTESMRAEWTEEFSGSSMPVDPSLWDDPPGSTELLNRAVLAAKEQGATEPYLRALWIEGIAAGQNLSEKDGLVSLAENMGLDVEKFEADMESAEVDTDTEVDELPVTEIPIRGFTQRWTGKVHYTDFKQQFIFEGLDEVGPPRLIDFVDAHGPVATEEVMEVYGRDRDETVEELLNTEGIYSLEIGEGTFWVTD